MAGIEEVLERLVADGDFRAALARDPASALADYHLTRDEIEVLASRLDVGDDAERTVEQRTSKSAMFALLTSLVGPGGGGTADAGHEDQVEVLSWSWGETQGDGTAPDDLAVPDDAAGELYNKSQGKVEYSWKVEEGVKAELDPDALTHKVDPGDAAPGGPSTDEQGIIIINGLEDDGTAEMEDVELDYNKVTFEEEPPDLGLTGAGEEPEEAVDVPLKIGDVEGEARDPATSPGDDPMDLGGVKAEVDPTDVGGVKAEVDPDVLTHKVAPSGDDAVGVPPPDDGVLGGIPPDDGVLGGTPPDDNLGTRTDVTAAMDADEVMEIEDV